MNRRVVVAAMAFLALVSCSKEPPTVLEIPELGLTMELPAIWRPADPADSENPFGFGMPRWEESGSKRYRVSKQPKGGTELAFVTGKFAFPNVTILGIPPRAGAKRTVDDCAKAEFEKPFSSVSWQLSPSTLSVPGMESRATIAEQQTTQGLDIKSEILVVEKDGLCYVFTGSTSPTLWKSQHGMIQAVLGSLKPAK